MTDIKKFVLGFNIDDYIQWLEKLVNMSPALEPDEDLENAYKVWNNCVLFWESLERNAPMSNDQKKELDKASMLIIKKTRKNELLSLRSKGVAPIGKNDFEMVKEVLNNNIEDAKTDLEDSLSKGIDKSIVFDSRLNGALEQIKPEMFIRNGVLIPIEKGKEREAVKMIIEIGIAQWILENNEARKEDGETKGDVYNLSLKINLLKEFGFFGLKSVQDKILGQKMDFVDILSKILDGDKRNTRGYVDAATNEDRKIKNKFSASKDTIKMVNEIMKK